MSSFLPRLIVGLGNPGKEYEMTRHNMGFLVIKALADQLGVSFRKESRFEGWRAKAVVDSAAVDLFFPVTYMNASGRAVQRILSYFDWQPNNLLVVVDDMAIPFGQMRLKAFGSSGGHNGLKSIEKEIGTSHYARLRIGIGASPFGNVDHVLGTFTQEERQQLPEVIDGAVNALKKILCEDFELAAGQINRKVQSKKEELQ